MSPLTTVGPTTAERIRSAFARAHGALLAIETGGAGAAPLVTPVHHLLRDGSFAVVVPTDIGGLERVWGSQAILELTDHAPLPLREPVRSLVWVRGRLLRVLPTAVPKLLDLIASENPVAALLQVQTPTSARSADIRYTLLRFDIASVVVTDATGAESVRVAELLAAQPDPFCGVETSLLQHLQHAHGDVVARLISRLPGPLRRGDVRPLGLDRYGVRFRVESSDGDRDVRLPFPKPVDDMSGLSQAIRVLMGCPFVNGVRARRN